MRTGIKTKMELAQTKLSRLVGRVPSASARLRRDKPCAPSHANTRAAGRGLPALPAAFPFAPASWSASAERSGDGAFASQNVSENVPASGQSGVALRLPPQSKIAAFLLDASKINESRWDCSRNLKTLFPPRVRTGS